MPDILHDFPIAAPADRVFAAVATPEGLDEWWTLGCEGAPSVGASWRLDFGPGYVWTADVRVLDLNRAIEWEMLDADADWRGTRVGFELEPAGTRTQVRFRHTGWREANDHFRSTSFCWAMYLRVLKRFVELGEHTAYEVRLDA